MKVKEVMLICARLLKEENAVKYLTGEAASDVSEAQRFCDDLIRFYDMTAEELACEYFPLEKLEEVSSNGKIKISSLEKTAIEIVSVEDEFGNKLPYKLINDSLETQTGNVKVKYRYKPKPAKEDDECPFSALPGGYVTAYAMAAEYCLENGLTGEAAVWQNKYSAAIRGRAAERRRLTIKARRWG